MFNIFDRIANWISETPDEGDRYLWVLNHSTSEITWKNRKVYSFWQSSETGRLQEIFKAMSEQLPYSLEASDPGKFQQLVELRERITRSYEGFLTAHSSFFGMIYQYFFAYDLTENYDGLIHKLNQIIASSISEQEISSLTPKEIEAFAKTVEKKGGYHSLDIDWEALTLEQFKAAYKLERPSMRITLGVLDKEKTTFLLESDKKRIAQFSSHDLEQNLAKIEPRFLCQLSSGLISSLDLSSLSSDDLVEILGNVDFYEHELHFVDLSLFTSDQIETILKKNPSILGKLPIETVAANLGNIDPKHYGKLTYTQCRALNFSQLTGDQFMNLSPGAMMYHYPREKIQDLNLNQFTTQQISKILESHPHFIDDLSPETVAANLAKFRVKALTSLNAKQIEALDFSQLTVDQLLNIEIYHITEKQWLKVKLTNFTSSSIAKLLKKYPYVLSKFSPASVSANLGRIDPSYYELLVDEQLKEIDFKDLNEQQKKSFPNYQLQKMKNYPKSQNKENFGGNFSYAQWQEDYFNNFFSQFGGFNHFGGQNQYSYKPFSGFGFRVDDEWQEQYFKPAGGTKGTAAQEEKLKPYRLNLTSAINTIKARNKSSPDPLYENLRLKCLNKGNELKNNPKLIFVDKTEDFDSSNLKKYYKKMILVFHPDKNKNNLEEATELFKVVNEAYKYLLPPAA